MNEKLIFILPIAGIVVALVLLFNYNLTKVEEPKDSVAKMLKDSNSNVNNSSGIIINLLVRSEKSIVSTILTFRE